VRAVLVAIVLGLAAGCGGTQAQVEEAAAPEPAELAEETFAAEELVPERRCRAGSERAVGNRREAYAVSVGAGRVAARTRPGGRLLARFGPENINGVTTVLGVVGTVVDRRCRPTWYHVQLPLRPNGVTGYVRAGAVRLHRVTTRIEVDLSARQVVFLRAGRRVMTIRTAIGSDATPTPTGRYYVNQRLLAADPEGPFGPGAIGISAFSPVLTGWAQGGPIAIHGTNDPGSIGQAVSNGCLRIENDTLVRLFRATPAGTPVVIEL
jgi:hypothetical protein